MSDDADPLCPAPAGAAPQPVPRLAPVGIDRLLGSTATMAALAGLRVGMLSSEAMLAADWQPAAHALHRALGEMGAGGGLARLFTPEHGWSGLGWSGLAPDGEGGGEPAVEPALGVPMVSLHGPRLVPDPAGLDDLDALVIDLQDAGVRCYTYATTCALVLRALDGRRRPRVILCDRPNPLGATVDGPGLEPRLRSFIGWLEVRFRHGRTLGELMTAWNAGLPGGGARLSVVPFGPGAAARPWVPPSPGLPTRSAALLYPGLVLLEGTNVSEGRGTALPFRCAAAPGLDGARLARRLNALADRLGVAARPIGYVPQTGKLAGRPCRGVQIHITDPRRVDGLALGVHLLGLLAELVPGFALSRAAPGAWRVPDGPAGAASGDRAAPADPAGSWTIDHLTGDESLRRMIERGTPPEALLAEWRALSPDP